MTPSQSEGLEKMAAKYRYKLEPLKPDEKKPEVKPVEVKPVVAAPFKM
jgi:hypothetical protein